MCARSVRVVFVRELHTKFLLMLGAEAIDVTTDSAGTPTYMDRPRGQLLVSAAMLPEGARRVWRACMPRASQCHVRASAVCARAKCAMCAVIRFELGLTSLDLI